MGESNVREEEKMKGSKRGRSFRGEREEREITRHQILSHSIMVTSFRSGLQGKDHDAHPGSQGGPGLDTFARSAQI